MSSDSSSPPSSTSLRRAPRQPAPHYARALRRPDEQWNGQTDIPNETAGRTDVPPVPDPGSAFDEAWYLVNNPDVAEAVSRGEFLSAWHHYLDHGPREGRVAAGVSHPAGGDDEIARHKGPYYLTPSDLALTPLTWTRVALVGSYSMDAWSLDQGSVFGCPVDRFSSDHDEPSIPVDPVMAANQGQYDLIVVEIALRSVMPDGLLAGLPMADGPAHEAALRQVCAAIEARLGGLLAFGSAGRIPVLVANFPLPQRNAQGLLARRYDVRNPEFFFDRINQHLEGFVRSFDGVFVLDIDRIAASLGRRGVQDDSLELLSRNSVIPKPEPVTDRVELLSDITSYFDVSWTELLPGSVGREIVAMARAIRQSDPVRLVVVNLDTTLWSGIRGDVADVTDALVEGWPIGLCEALGFLRKRGIRLALCSAQDSRWVKGIWPRVFRDRISLADFAVARIDRRPGPAKMRDILRLTALDPRAVLYIDGNPIERAAIKQEFPAIRVLGKNPYLLRRILLWSAELAAVAPDGPARPAADDPDAFGDDDAAPAEQGSTRLSFVDIRDPGHPRMPQIIGLLNGANRFNTTGERWRETMLAAFFARGGAILAFSADDGFSDFGLVGAVVIEPGLIRQIVLSLDSLGRGFEQAAVAAALRLMLRDGMAQIGGLVMPTVMNFPSRDVFAAAGFVRSSESLWIFQGTDPAVPAGVTMVFPEPPT